MSLNAFASSEEAQKYTVFLESRDGQFQRRLLTWAIKKRLPQNGQWKILDAGCGTGWLAHNLRKDGFTVEACDQSRPLLEAAKKNYPNILFKEADLTKPLPYTAQNFDAIILNMSAQDVPSLSALYSGMHALLKENGKLIVTIPNPYYAFPRAVWKRGFWGRLLSQKPTLQFAQKKFAPLEGRPMTTFPRPLPDYINQAIKQKLNLHFMEELRSETDSSEFGLQYQFFRYPLIVLLEFKKTLQ